MPRTKRIVLPDYSHHVFQRGPNKQAVFEVPEDFRRFLSDLRELKTRFGVRLYGWCLTSNQVHLLVEPPADSGRLGECLKSLFARTTRYRNRIERRTGTVWGGRYRSSPVHPDWTMRCVRYMERLPMELRLSNQLTGPSRFVEEVACMTGVRVPGRKRGRPRKS